MIITIYSRIYLYTQQQAINTIELLYGNCVVVLVQLYMLI